MQVFELPGPRTELQSVCFSPDGRWLVARGFGQVFLSDTLTGTTRVFFAAKSAYALAGAVGFTADGSGVLLHHRGERPYEIAVHALETAEVVRRRMLNRDDECEPGPGGRMVYIAVKLSKRRAAPAIRWNPLTGEEVPAMAGGPNDFECVAVSANERWAAEASESRVRIWNLGNPQRPAPGTRHRAFGRTGVAALALSADGAYLAAGTTGRPGVLFLADTRTGELWDAGPRSGDGHRDLAFHPTRPVLAHRGASGEAVFYDAVARAELHRFAWGAGGLTALAFSADGFRCAAGGAGKVVVWDADV